MTAMIKRIVEMVRKRTRPERTPPRRRGDARELKLREAEAEAQRLAAYKQMLERETDTWRKRYVSK